MRLNGYELAGRTIKVNMVSARSSHGAGHAHDADAPRGGGVSSHPQRVALMERLARPDEPAPTPASAAYDQ